MKRKIYRVAFFLLVLMSFSINVFASSSKTVDVNLPDSFVRCTFYATFENGIVRPTILISPDGDEYDFETDLEDERTLKCTVQDVNKGIWKVVAYDEESDSFDEVDDNENVSTSDSIGKIIVTVKTEEQKIENIEDNIKIAKEIAGLKYYWKDDSIVTEWTDETVGNVNISVIDSKTLKVLGRETIKGRYYELPIDQTLEEIIISITPATSVNIKGAELQYVVKVENNPDATVSFEEIEYTNKDSVQAKVTLNQPYSLLYVNNGNVVGKTEVLEIGTHDIEVPTVVGENNMFVYVVDEQGNMRSTQTNFIKDIEPPVLKISNDIDGIATYGNEITFSGVVEEYDFLIFRNENVEVEWDGNFTITASLKEGSNKLEVVASDKAGNETTYIANVSMIVKEPFSIPWQLAVLVGLIIFLIVFFLLKRRFGFSIKIPKGSSDSKNNEKIVIKPKSNIFDIIWLVVLISFVIIITGFVLQVGVVESASMEPAIMTGEITVTNKLAYVKREPERGDIVTFISKENGNAVNTKRIIGIPGDSIRFYSGYVVINDLVCDETEYLLLDVETNCMNTFEVPEDCYFMLGDNRDNSFDSRHWDNPYISKDDICGELILHTDIITKIKNLIGEYKY